MSIIRRIEIVIMMMIENVHEVYTNGFLMTIHVMCFVQVTLDAYCVSWRRLHSDCEEKLLVEFLPGRFFYLVDVSLHWGSPELQDPSLIINLNLFWQQWVRPFFMKTLHFQNIDYLQVILLLPCKAWEFFLSKPKSLKDQILNAPTPERGKGIAPAAMCRDRILQSAMFNLWCLLLV